MITVIDRKEVEQASAWTITCEEVLGALKTRVDFRVKEQARAPSLDPKGRFTVIRVTLGDWETNPSLSASACKISRNRIFSSGLKDKRAVLAVKVVDAKSKVIEEIEIPDTEIEILRRTHQKVGMGNHDGN